MFKRISLWIVLLLLLGVMFWPTARQSDSDRLSAVERSLNLSEAKGEISPRQAGQLHQRLNRLLRQRQLAAEGKVSAPMSADDGNIALLEHDLDLARRQRKGSLAQRFWHNWF